MNPLQQALARIEQAGWGHLAEADRARRLLDNPFSLPGARRLISSELQLALTLIEGLEQCKGQAKDLRTTVHSADTQAQAALSRLDSHLQHPGSSVPVLNRTLEQARSLIREGEAGRGRQLRIAAGLSDLARDQANWPESLQSYAQPRMERLRQRPPTERTETELAELVKTVQDWPRPIALPEVSRPPVAEPLPKLEPLRLAASGKGRPKSEAPTVEKLAAVWSGMDPGA